MGDLGLFASKFSMNSKSLREFDEALRLFRDEKIIQRTDVLADSIGKILNVITPITKAIKGELSTSTSINERRIIDILKIRHEKEWFTYKDHILEIKYKLNSEEFRLTKKEFQILNDIGDAIDSECAELFRRMSERV